MPSILAWAGQAAVYAAAAGMVGYLASSPAYQQVPEGLAQIKISFRHGGVCLADCKKLTPAEIAKLPANERRANTCNRERVPVALEIRIDGATAYEALLQPTGFSRDGPSETYKKILVPAGPHHIEARLRDSKRSEGFDYVTVRDVELEPFQNLAIDFKADRGGFLLR